MLFPIPDCGGSGVHAYASYPSTCEHFVLTDINGGNLMNGDAVTLRSANNYYVVAEGGGGPGQMVNANRSTANQWETFYIVSKDGSNYPGSGSQVAFLSYYGFYMVAEYPRLAKMAPPPPRRFHLPPALSS